MIFFKIEFIKCSHSIYYIYRKRTNKKHITGILYIHKKKGEMLIRNNSKTIEEREVI